VIVGDDVPYLSPLVTSRPSISQDIGLMGVAADHDVDRAIDFFAMSTSVRKCRDIHYSRRSEAAFVNRTTMASTPRAFNSGTSAFTVSASSEIRRPATPTGETMPGGL